MKIAERYSRATTSSHLEVKEWAGDVDVLIASGWANSGISQTLWRMKHTGKAFGFHSVAAHLNDWLTREATRKGVKAGGKNSKAFVVEPALFWWLHGVCKHCEGRGHPNIPDTPVMDESIDCPICDGEGVMPMTALINQKYIAAAKMLINKIERDAAEVEAQMKVSLNS